MKSSAECDLARQVLKNRLQADNSDSLLSLALDGGIEPEGAFTAAEIQVLEHVQACAGCQSWRETDLQPELFALRRRLSKYCCGQMFRAVAGRATERCVYLQPSGPEILHYWSFGETGPVIRYCPWCGAALPENSFE
jgi:hypothetical protein